MVFHFYSPSLGLKPLPSGAELVVEVVAEAPARVVP